MDIQAWLQGIADRRPPDQESFPSDDTQHTKQRPPSARQHQSRRRAAIHPHIRKHSPEEVVIHRPRGTTPDERCSAQIHDKRSSSNKSTSDASECDPPSSAAEQYYRRQRRKTRADRYELKTSKSIKTRKHTVEHVKARKTRRNDPEAALRVVRSFELNSRCKKRRLTLEPARQTTLFQHGRSSKHPTGQEGLPDLSFNELKFLQRTNQQDENALPPLDDAILDRRKQDAEISDYFKTKEPHNIDNLAACKEGSTASAKSQTSAILNRVAQSRSSRDQQAPYQSVDIAVRETRGLESLAARNASSTSMPLPEHHLNRHGAMLPPYRQQRSRDNLSQASISTTRLRTPQVISPEYQSQEQNGSGARQYDRPAQQLTRPFQLRAPYGGRMMQEFRADLTQFSPRGLSLGHGFSKETQPLSPAQLHAASARSTEAGSVPEKGVTAGCNAPAALRQPYGGPPRSILEGLPRRQLHSLHPGSHLTAVSTTVELQASASNTMLWRRQHLTISEPPRETCNAELPPPRLYDHSLDYSGVTIPDKQTPSTPAFCLVFHENGPSGPSSWLGNPNEDHVMDPSIDQLPGFEFKDFWKPNRLY